MRKQTMMAAIALAGLALVGTPRLMAQAPSAEEILKRIDANRGENKVAVSSMTIHGRRGSRTLKSKSWIEGTEKSFTEFLEPPREKGTKMLKLGDELWTYTPSTDRTIKIAGHMLRQAVMGSDLSYEDMMEDPELTKVYNAKVSGEEAILDRPCWVLDLEAKIADVAYYSRKIWVDRERYVVVKEERYAKSGKLLKTMEAKSTREVQGRWLPDDVIFRDVLKEGSGTEFVIESIAFNEAIPASFFSKASLRR